MKFKPKNKGDTNTGNRLFVAIVAVCQTGGQQKNDTLLSEKGLPKGSEMMDKSNRLKSS